MSILTVLTDFFGGSDCDDCDNYCDDAETTLTVFFTDGEHIEISRTPDEGVDPLGLFDDFLKWFSRRYNQNDPVYTFALSDGKFAVRHSSISRVRVEYDGEL